MSAQENCEKIGRQNYERKQQNHRRLRIVTDFYCRCVFQYDSHFNRFWFRHKEEEIYFREIQTELNSSKDIQEFQSFDDIEIGQVVAALHDGVYSRAKVLQAMPALDTVLYNVWRYHFIIDGNRFNWLNYFR